MEGEEVSIPRGREGDYKEILRSDGTGSSSSEVRDLLSYLERLENGWKFDPRVKDDIHTLRLMISTLVPFFVLISKWQDDQSWGIYFPVASVIEDVIEELQLSGMEVRLSVDADVRSSSAIADLVLSNLRKLRLIKPEMEKLYFVVSGSSEPLATGKGEDAVRCLDSLLENLKDLLCYEADLMLLLKQQMNLLTYFLLFLSKICNLREYLDDLFAFAEAVAVEAACVLYFLLVEKENKIQENKTKLLPLVGKIRPFQPEVRMIYLRALEDSRSVIIGPLEPDEYVLGFFDSLIHNLRELSSNESNFGVELKDRTEILLEELSLVRRYLIDTPLHYYKEGLDNFMTELLDLTIDIGVFIFSYEGLESEQKFGDLMDKVQFIKSASGDFLIPRSWQSHFPRTDELGFINFIITNLKEQLNSHTGSGDLTIVYKELVALRDDFVKITELRKEDERLSALITRYKDVAYQAEYFVDLSVFGTVSLQYIRSGLTDTRESIRQIRTEVKAIAKKTASDSLAHSTTNGVGVVSSEAVPASHDAPMGSKGGAGSNNSEATDQLGSLEDEARKIKEQLTGGSEKLNILSIVGMPGIGKTNLANLVYKDPSVTGHFHAQAWCSVSQEYERQALLLKIFHQVQRETEQDRRKNVDLYQQLYQSLKGRRYLVILDDIWDIEVWADLRLSFPDDNNGSRLVFTTRNREVALHANSVLHDLPLLSDEDSWKLLKVKVFEKETCPPELFGIGKRIAESCRGLPLAVVLIAGLLKTTEGNRDCWERVGNQLRSYVLDNPQGEQLGTLELSYMHLPDCLKPCFLYFGAFAEDAEIPARKLVRLWIAEGFVQPPKIEQNSLEYEAENYLNALIDRSLVMVAKRSSTGGVKACRIHDLLREFCLVRAKEDRFLLPISRNAEFPTFKISKTHEQYLLQRYDVGVVSSEAIPASLDAPMGSKDCWVRVRNQLRSYVPRQLSVALKLSYMQLPDRMKPCFSYFGAFAEDGEIPLRKLQHLWIAEGFLEPPNYLNALNDRSPVMFAKRSSTGGVKACRIHDLSPISRYAEIPTFFRISELHEQYRLCIHSNCIPSVRVGHFTSRVRTLLFSSGKYVKMSMRRFCSPGSSSRPGCYDCLNDIDVVNKFRLLRVLDLGAVGIGDENILNTISQLVYLRYLAVGFQPSIIKIPIEFANLKNLETFILSTWSSETDVLAETVFLAETIWSMVSLRHLLIDGDFYFRLDSSAKSFQKLPKLENLTSLSIPTLYHDKDIEKMMRNLPNLQKLKCVFFEIWDPSKGCNHFPVLDFLDRLESLKVSFSGKGLYPCSLSFPLSIKKLTLSDFQLPWDEISIIGRLPKLEVLKLDRAFEGREWDMKDGEFQKLKFLKLEDLDIKIWNASSEQLPCLEQLVLDGCSDLEQIPPAFGEISTLRMIDMKWCKTSARNSVKQIEEDQHDMGNDQFNVFISRY